MDSRQPPQSWSRNHASQGGPPGWGQPPQQQPPQGWGQQQPPQGWGQQPQQQPPQGWGQPPQQQGWGQPPQQPGWEQPHQPPVAWQQARPTGALLNDNQQRFMTKVFGWMFMGLGLTAMVAYGTFALGFLPVVFGFRWILLIAQLGLVFWLSASLMKMKPATAAGTFLGYSALNGLTLGAIFAIYNPISIALTFAGTASMFGFLFVLGLVVKRDLSTMGRFLIMTVWGLVVMSLINMVAMSFGWLGGEQAQSFHLLISYAGVFIFSGLTVYDAQKLKNLSRQGFANPDDEQRLSVLGALTLYLDFINLFLFLLRILGDRR